MVAAVSLAPASQDDAARFAAMEQDPDTRGYILPCTAAEHRRNMRDRNMVYLRIVESQTLAGFIVLVLDPDGSSVEFRRIVISDKGRGIGQTAIECMEHYCAAHLGRRRIWLDVFEHNQRGRHIYQKLGYRRFGAAESDGQKLLLYQKNDLANASA